MSTANDLVSRLLEGDGQRAHPNEPVPLPSTEVELEQVTSQTIAEVNRMAKAQIARGNSTNMKILIPKMDFYLDVFLHQGAWSYQFLDDEGSYMEDVRISPEMREQWVSIHDELSGDIDPKIFARIIIDTVKSVHYR